VCQMSSKSLEPRLRYGVFGYFKMAAAAILDFPNFDFFNGRARHECRTASLCQISSKLLKPRPRYVSFNIMLVWLENAYSRPCLGAHFPQMMSLIVLTPKRTIRGLNHVICAINHEYFCIDFCMGLTRVLYFPLA